MNPVTRFQRIYYSAVGLFALWVGVWGYFIPGQVDRAIPWLVPPLHARFIGAIYLAAVTLLFGSALARRWAEVRVSTPMVAVWTGSLLLISLLHLDDFDFSHSPVWFWFGAYIVYPIIALWLAWQNRAAEQAPVKAPIPQWVKSYLFVQGAGFTLLAAGLLLAPAFMSDRWPWLITPLLAQIYSGPFLAYGLGSLSASRRTGWEEVRVPMRAMLVFAVLVLIASVLHLALFDPAAPSAWLWFGGFGAATIALFGGFLRASIPSQRSPNDR